MIVSVAICTHNPRADFFGECVAALRAQTLPQDQWEFLIIDNCSTPPVDVDLTWHPNAKIIREETPGLTPARLRAIQESSASLLVFVDDDNILYPDYLETALEIEKKWPMLGTWGGQTLPGFEVEPPEWTREFWLWLAVREFDRDYWSNIPHESQALPYGAGMCVRREVAATYAKKVSDDTLRKTLDRSGKQLLGGGDADISFIACDMGLGNGIFTDLKLRHRIAKERLEESYLLKLVESMTYSQTILFSFRGQYPIRPSRSQRLLQFYERLHIPARDKRFDEAIQRGREAALAFLEKSNP